MFKKHVSFPYVPLLCQINDGHIVPTINMIKLQLSSIHKSLHSFSRIYTFYTTISHFYIVGRPIYFHAKNTQIINKINKQQKTLEIYL